RYAADRPKEVALLVTLAFVGLGLVGHLYAIRQWRAAQTALDEERPFEARDCLKFCLLVWPRSLEVNLLAARIARLTEKDLNVAESYLNRCLKLQNGATEAVQLEFLLLRVQGGEVDELAPILIDIVDKGHPEAPII